VTSLRVHPSNILPVSELCQQAMTRWRAAADAFPEFGARYSEEEQIARERCIDGHLDIIARELEDKSAGRANGLTKLKAMIPLMAEITAYSLDLDDPDVRRLLNEGLSEISFELVRRARVLDPSVTLIDILQAARNAWTACALQLLLGRPLCLTPSIFAYSMLYPYSDNYLDDATVSREVKTHFNERFGRRLEGDPLRAENEREKVIWELVGLIESEYLRASFPQVYASLLAIHRAQQESLHQLHGDPNSVWELACLTITKGGTSVLADAYLAAGDLTLRQARAAFNWGVVLQLGDDLQDFHSDRERGSLTLFTQLAQHEPLDELTNRTFHFARNVLSELPELETCPPILAELLARSSRLLLIRSVAGAAEFYMPDYLERLQTYSPFRFDFLRGREQRFANRTWRYAQLFEDAAQELCLQP
jgi:hypothetical protein